MSEPCPDKRRRSRLTLAVALGVTLLLWGTAFPAIRAGLRHYSPGHVALIRFLAAVAVLAPYAVYRRLRRPHRSDLFRIVLTGLLGVGLYHALLNHGLVSVHAGPASMIVNMAPVFTTVLAAWALKERISLRAAGGLVISFGGAALIGLAEGGGMRLSVGVFLLIGAALCWAANIVLQKPLLERYSALEITCYAIFLGTPLLLAFLPGLAQAGVRAPWSVTMGLVYLGVFPIAVAYGAWVYVLSQMSASRAASFLYLIPVIATAAAWALLGETPPVLSLAGGALVLAGVAVVNTQTGREKRTVDDVDSCRPSASIR